MPGSPDDVTMAAKFSAGPLILRYGLKANAVFLAEAVEPADVEIPIFIRAELGIRPDVEIIHFVGKIRHTVDTWDVRRAQEGSTAEAWPIGTPIAFVAVDADPLGRLTLNLAHPFPASSVQLDLQGVYRRWRVDDEIIHDPTLVGDDLGTGGPHIREFVVERAREGTTEAAHAAGATVTFLAPGET